MNDLEEIEVFFRHQMHIQDEKAIELLKQKIIPKHFKKNSILIMEGEVTQYLFFVIEGVTRAYWTDSTYKERTFTFAQRGEVVLALQDWNYNCYEAPATWGCATDCKVLALALNDALTMARTNLTLGEMTQALLVNSVRTSQNLLFCRTQSLLWRVEWFHAQYPKLVGLIKKQHIAEFLDMDKSTYSRIIKQKMEGENE